MARFGLRAVTVTKHGHALLHCAKKPFALREANLQELRID